MRIITKQLSVMLVDDDPDDREIFSEALSEILKDFSLRTFKDGQEITDFLGKKENQAQLPDIIFLDINLPVIDGLETLSIIRDEFRIHDVPIAMYSTSSLDSDIAKALAAGANIYIKKPNTFSQLTETLYKVLYASIQKENLDMGNFLFSI